VHPGKSYTLTPKLVPANSGIPITWSSSNTAVATVNQGVVTVKSTADIGETATITAKAGGLQATCVLTVFGEKFGLEIDGVQVTTDNLGDILGNGVFSFDGRNVLTINGSYSSSDKLIYNYGVDDLTIYVKGNSTLTCTGSGKDAIVLHPDTTITGSGKLTVHAASGCGIYASSDDTTLTVENVTLVASGEWGIAGLSGSNGTALRIRHANVTASGGSGKYGYVWEDNDSAAYTFSDPSVAEIVDKNMDVNGCNQILRVNCLKEGETTLTVTAADGRTASCLIRVLPRAEFYTEPAVMTTRAIW
jgi:hypothetical protein